MPKKYHILIILLAGFTLGSCSYTKYVAENELLLWDQKIKLADGGKPAYETENILKQQANASVLGLRTGLALYNWGNGTDSSFWGRVGSAPVIFDSLKTTRSSEQLQNFYFNKGFFKVRGSFLVDKTAKGQKAKVTYFINRGPRYRISEINYRVETDEMKGLVNYFMKDAEIKAGMYYDAEKLDAERDRLREIFRNHGYYNFSKNFINYSADTLGPPEKLTVALELIVSNRSVRQGDTTLSVPHQKHKIEKVIIVPDYSFIGAYMSSDTINYRNYQIAYDSLQYKPRYLTDAIHFKAGSTYKYNDVKNSYNHLANYNAFELTEISFVPLPGDSTGTQLLGRVRLSPRDRLTFSATAEVTNTSNNYGITGSIGIVNRNLFKAGEALHFDISSGIEYQPTVGTSENLSRTFEIGAELGIDFPRFVLPFNTVGLLPKRMQPVSSVSIFARRTARVEFDRETFGGRLVYNWRENELKNHRVTLLNLSYSNLLAIDQTFRNQLNDIQQLAFSSEFISSTSWTFIYNGQSIPNRNTYHFFKSDAELGGLTQSLFAQNQGEGNLPQIADVPIYQFARLEAEYRYYWRISEERTLIQRLLTGYVMPFGQSTNLQSDLGKISLPPFSRFFFLGGSNGMRAWPAYRAGGGSERITGYAGTPEDSSGFSFGTLKFLFNSEYRFPLIASLNGAVFLDAGNVWLTGGLEKADPPTGFEFTDFFNELYLGSGFGLRLDLDYFIIRFDIGVKLRDPGYLSRNEEWVIATKPVLPNLTYNVALGYPF